MHYTDTASEFGGFLHIMGNENDSGAKFLVNHSNLVLQHGAHQWVERGKRFIHQQHLGLGGNGAQNADALLFTAGKFVRIAVAVVRRVKFYQL